LPATGRLGGIRSLQTWEILAQHRLIAAEADHPVRGVVFMGMGEPFLNYENVIRAARILSDPAGAAIAAKAISISTAGVVPAIRRFTAEGHHFRLIVSLGAPTSADRHGSVCRRKAEVVQGDVMPSGHGVPVRRIINGGGIPQKNAVLNQVYANVMGKPILVPNGDVTSLGSAIFAFMAAGAFPTIEAAQDQLCPGFRTIEPDPAQAAKSAELYALYRRLYFAFGQRNALAVALGDILPALRSK